MSLTLDEIKDIIGKEGYQITQERVIQSPIINLRITFSKREENKTFEFTQYNVKYIKEMCELLTIIYNEHQYGTLNPNFAKLILTLHEKKDKFPLFIREVFQNTAGSIKFWKEEDKLDAITSYIHDQSFLSSWRAQSGTEQLQAYSVELHYPKIVLDVIPSTEEFDRTIIYE